MCISGIFLKITVFGLLYVYIFFMNLIQNMFYIYTTVTIIFTINKCYFMVQQIFPIKSSLLILFRFRFIHSNYRRLIKYTLNVIVYVGVFPYSCYFMYIFLFFSKEIHLIWFIIFNFTKLFLQILMQNRCDLKVL